MKQLKIGDKVSYIKEYMFGKTGQECGTVVALRGGYALLDNGDEIFAMIAEVK